MERSMVPEYAVSSHFILKCGVGLITLKRFKVNSIPVICSIWCARRWLCIAICGHVCFCKIPFVLYLSFIFQNLSITLLPVSADHSFPFYA